MKLTQKDINDIANGYHNKYVEAQDKDELIKHLASKLKIDYECDQFFTVEEVEEIESNIHDIENALDNIKSVFLT